MNTLSEILKTQKLDIEILLNDHQTEISNHFKQLTIEIELLKENLKERDEKILKLSNELKDNDFNNQNYQNFSLVSNLSKQIREKDLELKTCNSQLRLAKKEIDTLKEKLELISEKDDIEDQNKSNVQLYIEEQSKLIDEITPQIQPQPAVEEITTEKQIETQIENKKSNEKTNEKTKKNEKKIKDKQSKPVVEEVKEPEPKPEPKLEPKLEPELEEEEEISYVRKKIKGKYYFISDEKPPKIYEYLEGNEVGELVGKMNDNKAEFL
jgi:hypothetical protein